VDARKGKARVRYATRGLHMCMTCTWREGYVRVTEFARLFPADCLQQMVSDGLFPSDGLRRTSSAPPRWREQEGE